MSENTSISNTNPELYRDDDASVYADAYLFKCLHEKFFKGKRKHTVAVLMKDLWQNHALFWYLATEPEIEIGLHGWEHKDYSLLGYEECYEDIKKSLEYWNENSTRMLGYAKKITTFFAPWNHTGPGIKRACDELGLKFCATDNGEWNGYNIRSFHWWNIMDNEFTI